MTPARCAIVGHGMIGSTHAQILDRLPEAELVAVVDTNRNTHSSDTHGAPYFDSLEAALEACPVDAVWVCTPPQHHRDTVLTALARGIHVYCEKPVAHTLEDAEAMRSAAASSTATLAVGHTLRFHPDVQALAAAVRDGSIGDAVQANARWATNDLEGKLLSGRVSVAQEMSIHHIDVLRWLMGDIEEVYATASGIAPTGPGPDAVSAVLRFRSGAIATLDHNWVMPAASGAASDQRISVFGSLGTAYFDAHEPFTRHHTARGTRHFHTAYRGFDNTVPSGALATADRHFLASIRSDDDARWPLALDDAIEALRVALAIDRSTATGTSVKIGAHDAN